MGQDILIKADGTGLYDLSISDKDFSSAEGFETVIPTSYFSNARASSALVQNAEKREGWIGNILNEDGRELGGLLWILDQSRLTQETINLAQTYAKESLQFLIDDGIAIDISISVEQAGQRAVKIITNITTAGNKIQKYVSLWRSTDFERITHNA